MKLFIDADFVVYKCTAGYDTIGYGKRIKYLKVTEEEAEECLKEDLTEVAS